MAGKKVSPPEIVEKRFPSVGEVKQAIKKLRRRVDEVQKLKEDSVRHDDPKKTAIETKIRDTIREIYGPHSPQFERHQRHFISHNPDPVSFGPLRGEPARLAALHGPWHPANSQHAERRAYCVASRKDG